MKYTSFTILALLGQVDAIQIVKKGQMRADDFDEDDTSNGPSPAPISNAIKLQDDQKPMPKVIASKVKEQKKGDTEVNQNLEDRINRNPFTGITTKPDGTQVTADGVKVDQDLQLKSIKAVNQTLNAIQQNVDQMFEQSFNNIGLKAEQMTIDKSRKKQKLLDSIDDHVDTQEQVKEQKKRFNPFDGLWHNDNGTVMDVNGQPVSHAQIKHRDDGKDKEDNMAEGEARSKELDAAKAQQLENERKEKERIAVEAEEARKAELRAEFNPFDGLRHKKDGSLQDPETGAPVNGANHGIAYTQKKHHHKKHHRHGAKKTAKAEAKPVTAPQKKKYSNKDDPMDE